MDLDLIAKFIGFGTFKAMAIYFTFLAVMGFVGYGIYIGQKGDR